MNAGNTPANSVSKQPRIRVIVPSVVPPWLPESERALVHIYRPTQHDIYLTLPPLVAKCDGIAACFEYSAKSRSTAPKVSFSYKDVRHDPANPTLPRGLICPNCTSNQTAFGHMRVVKEAKHPQIYCVNHVIFRRYPVNPCIACFVCQTNEALMDRLWHHCTPTKEEGRKPVHLAPNYRDRRAEVCELCKYSPANVTCMCA